MTFFTHKQIFTSKKQLFGGTVYKICMVCMFRRIDDFVVKVIKIGHREVTNSFVLK